MADTLELRVMQDVAPPQAESDATLPLKVLGGGGTPYEMGETPGGAVTGRALITGSNLPGAEDTGAGRAATRLASEVTGAGAGGAVGSAVPTVVGRRLGIPPAVVAPVAHAGMRVGETVGAGVGSLAAEFADPTANPAASAFDAALWTAATGAPSDFLTAFARRLIGKPTESGQALIDVMAQSGHVPPPGMVLSGTFAKSAESMASASWFLNEGIVKAAQQAVDIPSEAIRNYVSSFQRYYDTAKLAFQRAGALASHLDVKTPGELLMAAQPVLEQFGRQNLEHKMGPGLKMILEHNRLNPGQPLAVPFDTAQELQNLIFERAHELRRAAARGEEYASDKLASAAFDEANRMRDIIDVQLELAIRNKQVPVEARGLLAGGRAAWSQWQQGKVINEVLLNSAKDLTADGPVRGQRIIAELDKLARAAEQHQGREVLAPQVVENMRKYALALRAAEEANKTTSFTVYTRGGQIMAVPGMVAGMAAGSPLAATAAGAMLMTPPMLSWAFSNKRAAALLIRGMHVEPGTAAAMRITREFLTLAAKEGIMPPERVPESENVQQIPQTTREELGGVGGGGGVPTTVPETPEDPYQFGRLRGNLSPKDTLMHSVVAPLEHREFATEAVKQNLAAAPSLAIAAPLYSIAKGLGILNRDTSTSPATMDEVFAAYQGIGRGLRQRFIGR